MFLALSIAAIGLIALLFGCILLDILTDHPASATGIMDQCDMEESHKWKEARKWKR